MTGKQHVGIGIISMYMLDHKLTITPSNLVFATGTIIGSLLPDCDIVKAPAGKVLPLWLFMKHRTYTHSLLATLFITAITTYFNKSFGLGIGFGYGLHLLADATTPMRLPYFLWGFKKIKNNNKKHWLMCYPVLQ